MKNRIRSLAALILATAEFSALTALPGRFPSALADPVQVPPSASCS